MGRTSKGPPRRRAKSDTAPRRPAASAQPANSGPSDSAEAALRRLLTSNRPGRLSLAGAYAIGYTALALAQQDEAGPDWYHDLDPLDTLFLGTAWPGRFTDEASREGTYRPSTRIGPAPVGRQAATARVGR